MFVGGFGVIVPGLSSDTSFVLLFLELVDVFLEGVVTIVAPLQKSRGIG